MKNKKLNFVLIFVFTALVLYFSLRNHFDDVVDNVLTINIWWFIATLLLMAGYWFLKSVIIKIYVNNYKKNYSYKQAYRLQTETLFFNAVTPFSSGGQPFQVLSLKSDGVNVSDGTNIMVMTSFIHQFAMFTLSIICIISNQFLDLFAESTVIRNLSILGFIINIIFMIVLILLSFEKKFKRVLMKFIIKILNALKIVKNKKEVIKNWEDKLEYFDESAKLLLKNKKLFINSLAINVLALVCYYLIPLTLVYGMGVYTAFNPFECIIAATYVDLVGMFVPIPGGTGGLEFAFVSLFGNFLAADVVSSLMLLWRFVTYYLGLIVGAIVLNFRKGKTK